MTVPEAGPYDPGVSGGRAPRDAVSSARLHEETLYDREI
jgi:hypothetical protein